MRWFKSEIELQIEDAQEQLAQSSRKLKQIKSYDGEEDEVQKFIASANEYQENIKKNQPWAYNEEIHKKLIDETMYERRK